MKERKKERKKESKKNDQTNGQRDTLTAGKVCERGRERERKSKRVGCHGTHTNESWHTYE